MLKKSYKLTPGLVAALAIIFGICTAQPVHAEKILRYSISYEIAKLDPAQVFDITADDVLGNIFEPPVRFAWMSDTLEPVTLVAMPTVSADFRTYTFHVRPGIFFADDPAFRGKKRELTAEDYVFSWKRFYDPKVQSPIYSASMASYRIESLEALRRDAIKSGHFDYDKAVEGLQALDRYTFQIRIPAPAPRFLEDNASTSNFGVVAREVVEKYGMDIADHPVGTGPYLLYEWLRSSKIVFRQNPNFRRTVFAAEPTANDGDAEHASVDLRSQKMPFIDQIELAVIAEAQPAWLSFLNNDEDFIKLPPVYAPVALPNGKLAPNLAKMRVRAYRHLSMTLRMYAFNMDDSVIGGYAVENVALRRAISLAIDVRAMIARGLSYQGIPSQSVIVPGETYYDATLNSESGSFDPDRANAILDVFGFRRLNGEVYRRLPDGRPLTLICLTWPGQENRVYDEVLVRSMEKIGIHVKLETTDITELEKLVAAGTFQMVFLQVNGITTDPSDELSSFYSPNVGDANFSRFKLPEYDALYERQDAIPDGLERAALVRHMRDLLIAFAPIKPLFTPIYTAMMQPWVIGYRDDPLIQGWWAYVDIDEKAQDAHRHRM